MRRKKWTPDLLGRFVRMISDKLPTNDTIHFKDNIGNSVDDAMRMCRQNDMDLATTSELRDAYNSGYRLNAFGRTVEDMVNPHDTFDMSGGGNQGAFCIAKTKILPHIWEIVLGVIMSLRMARIFLHTSIN